LEQSLEDYGLDAIFTRQRLDAFLAVQNTYLSTFQSLGALGLLLGTFGLAAVQLRGVLERRGELALMRAAGFRRATLARMVLWENAVLLVGGIAIGVLAAAVAVWPHWRSQSAAIPWTALVVMLAVIVAVGLAAGLATVRAVLRAPLLPALRGE
jgi:ABC-type antimicrobial peptide transport system permease subunit